MSKNARMRFTNGRSFLNFVKAHSKEEGFPDLYSIILTKGESIVFRGMDSSRVGMIDISFVEKKPLPFYYNLLKGWAQSEDAFNNRFRDIESLTTFIKGITREEVEADLLKKRGFTIERVREILNSSQGDGGLMEAISEATQQREERETAITPECEINVYHSGVYTVGGLFKKIYESLKEKKKKIVKEFDLEIEFRGDFIYIEEKDLGYKVKKKYSSKDLETLPMENIKAIRLNSFGIPTESLTKTIDFFSHYILYLECKEEARTLMLSQESIKTRSTLSLTEGTGLFTPPEYPNIKNGYSLSYLKGWIELLKAQIPSAYTIFDLKQDNPLRVIFNIDSLNLVFNGFLAPRVEETDFGSEPSYYKYSKKNDEKGYLFRRAENLYDRLIKARIIGVYLPEIKDLALLREQLAEISSSKNEKLMQIEKDLERLEDEVNFKLEPLKREALSTYLILF